VSEARLYSGINDPANGCRRASWRKARRPVLPAFRGKVRRLIVVCTLGRDAGRGDVLPAGEICFWGESNTTKEGSG